MNQMNILFLHFSFKNILEQRPYWVLKAKPGRRRVSGRRPACGEVLLMLLAADALSVKVIGESGFAKWIVSDGCQVVAHRRAVSGAFPIPF